MHIASALNFWPLTWYYLLIYADLCWHTLLIARKWLGSGYWKLFLSTDAVTVNSSVCVTGAAVVWCGHICVRWQRSVLTAPSSAGFPAHHTGASLFVCVQSNVCKHVADSRNHHLFSSPQCLGYSFEFGRVTDDLCCPSKDIILNQVKRAVDRFGSVALFVATDRDAMIADFEKKLKGKVRCGFPNALCK